MIFKAKRKDNGEWMEGELDLHPIKGAWIVVNEERFEIDETADIYELED